MEPKDLLVCLQEPVTCPCPELDQSIPCPPSHFPKIHFNSTEGRGFDSRWCHWNCSLILSFRPPYGPGFDPVSNRNEHQEYFLEIKAPSV